MKAKVKKLSWKMIAILAVVPVLVFGDSTIPQPQGSVTGITNPIKATSLSDFIKEAVDVFRNLVFLVAVIMIVYAGYLFITARGDTVRLAKAKNAFLWAIVGTGVILGAWVFANALDATISNL